MDNALITDDMRFISRHLVPEPLDSGYAVTVFSHGNHDNPFKDDPRVQHVQGDRTNDETL